ncbi:MAG: DUF2000 domain-containing protein [Anaerolineae bacterium]|nr:DUF2000 domain-containing protein [Anaerolineae bacterium]
MAVGAGQTDYKFVLVLSKKIDAGVLINAAAHMSACIAARANDEQRRQMMITDYIDADGGLHPVSALSLVILKADNANQIRKARQAATEKQVLFVDFVESMTKNTYVEQMAATQQLKESDLEYWGLCLFGKKDDLNAITGKFSLWR